MMYTRVYMCIISLGPQLATRGPRFIDIRGPIWRLEAPYGNSGPQDTQLSFMASPPSSWHTAGGIFAYCPVCSAYASSCDNFDY